MLRSYDVLDLIIVPVLKHMDLDSKAARQLILGTAIMESQLVYLRQLGNGPAIGLWQMEPATHDDIWKNYLLYRPDWIECLKFYDLRGQGKAENMVGNLYYACAMARMHYFRVPQKLPEQDDAFALAAYWKRYYNSYKGAGTIDGAVLAFEQAIQIVNEGE